MSFCVLQSLHQNFISSGTTEFFALTMITFLITTLSEENFPMFLCSFYESLLLIFTINLKMAIFFSTSKDL